MLLTHDLRRVVATLQSATAGQKSRNAANNHFHGLARQPVFDRVMVWIAFESIQAIPRTKAVLPSVILPAVPVIRVNGHSTNGIFDGECIATRMRAVAAVRWISISRMPAAMASVGHSAAAVAHHQVKQSCVN